MKYANGKDIFPEALLKQIQKYISGAAVYIPATTEKKAWGETSGYKRYILERNCEIRKKFKAGACIEALSEEYALSSESIKKIVYTKKEVVILDYHCSLSSAVQFAENNKLEEWIHTYLLSDGHNKDFSDGLKLFDRYFLGPVKMPLNLFSRCCGPEQDMKYQIPEEWFEKHVLELENVIQTEKDMPPLIVHYVDSGFELNDGNHRLEAYKRLGINEYFVIIWITEKEEYDEFISKYKQYLNN